MMSASSAAQAAATLRASFRRLRWHLGGGAGGTLALLPLALAQPAGSAALVLLAGIAVYLARRGYQGVRVWQHVDQLLLEEQFVAQPFDAGLLRQCLRRRDHLWRRSRVLAALRTLRDRPLPDALPPGRREERLARRFHRAFRPLRPAWPALDGLLGLALLGIAAGAAAAAGPGTLSFWVGLLAMPLLLWAEYAQWTLRSDLRRGFEALEGALGAWALAPGALPRPGPEAYRHTLLYWARPWFGSQEEPAASAPGEAAA